jgi:RNAse (barnase) inhibitor barstar
MRDGRDFHRNLAAALGDRLRVDYGNNLDALKDVVSLEIAGPLDIHWSDHASAQQHLPHDFYAAVIEIFRKREADDARYGQPTVRLILD